MKTRAELAEIRRRTKEKIEMKGKPDAYRILVGMATCGQAAGAEPVLRALRNEAEKRSLHNVEIAATGCIGLCRFEPIVEVYSGEQKRITYVNVNTEKAQRIILEHIVNGAPVEEYTVLHAEQNKGVPL